MRKRQLRTQLLTAVILIFVLLIAPVSSAGVHAQEDDTGSEDSLPTCSAEATEDAEGVYHEADGTECAPDTATTGTEEATAEPTEEVTEEPTEEPTAEPTAEPTEEVTEEPTEEPTAEPTAEPTEEVTEEPTEEPTAEPTAEPTEEVTEEPTEEPTAEPTATPAPEIIVNSFTAEPAALTQITASESMTTTLSWDVAGIDSLTLTRSDDSEAAQTVEAVGSLGVEVITTTTFALYTPADEESEPELVAQVVVTMEEPVQAEAATIGTAGEIGGSAVVGTWTSQYVTVQNLGAGPTTVSLQLYDSGGNSVGSALSPATNPVPTGGAGLISISSVANGQYSGLIQSGEKIASAVMNVNNSYKVGDLYLGVNNASQQQYVPIIYKTHFGWNTLLHVQNAHSSAQNIRVRIFNVGQSSASADVTYNTVASNGYVPTIDLANDAQYSGVLSGNVNGFGYALIEGGSGNIAVVARHIRDDGVSETLEASFAALPTSEAGRDFVAPVVFNNWFNWYTALTIVNLSTTTDTSITVNYAKNNGSNSYSQNLPAGAMQTFWPNGAFDQVDKSFGSITVNSSATDVVVVVNSNKSPFQGIGQSVPALNLNNATSKLAVPLIFNDGNWDAAAIAYAVDAGTFTAKWVPFGEDPTTNTNSSQFTLSSGGFEVLWGTDVPSSGITGGISRGKMGVLYITADNGTSKIMAQANFNTPEIAGGVMAAGIPGFNY